MLASLLARKTNCACAAHSQHIVFRYLWNHPSACLKDIAIDLHLEYSNVKQIVFRIRNRVDCEFLCPECFGPSLFNLVCESCGFEADKANIPIEPNFNSQSPVYRIQPFNGLGSHTEYNAAKDFGGKQARLNFRYGGNNIKHLVEPSNRSLIERCKSDIWQAFKKYAPADSIVEEANRFLVKEIMEFKHRYPLLIRSTNARAQIVKNVLELVSLRYPKFNFEHEVNE